MRVAAIDCGTNSVRLLVTAVAEIDGRVTQHDLDRRMQIVRLGQGVDRTGRLSEQALARTRTALTDYARVIERSGVQRTRFVATSATRDASNRDEFAAMVRDCVGVEPEIVAGAEEARLSFAGATSVVDDAGDVLVVDIGGGSTELVRSRPAAELESVSVDVGAVRMTERHLRHDPPTVAELDAIRSDVRAALDDAAREVTMQGARAVVTVAGTATTVAAIALGLDRYESERIHASTVTAAQVFEIAARLQTLDRAGREGIAVIHPGRVDVIAAGATILAEVVRRAGADHIVISEHDILDGIALSLLDI